MRVAIPDDSGLLADLGARTFHGTFAPDNNEADMSAYLARSFSADIQARELADARTVFLVAEREGGAVAEGRHGTACTRTKRVWDLLEVTSALD